MSNIQKQHKISPAIAWLTIQKFIIFYCPLDGEHTRQNNFGVYFSHYYNVPIQDASGDYVLQIPLYDMGPFMELTGVKVEGQE